MLGPCNDCGALDDLDCVCWRCSDCNGLHLDASGLTVAQSDEDADTHGDDPRCIPCWQQIGCYL